ncbi:hypothetical protein H632_c1940p0, partial [Helicosporidium sp. ATCC 50920]
GDARLAAKQRVQLPFAKFASGAARTASGFPEEEEERDGKESEAGCEKKVAAFEKEDARAARAEAPGSLGEDEGASSSSARPSPSRPSQPAAKSALPLASFALGRGAGAAVAEPPLPPRQTHGARLRARVVEPQLGQKRKEPEAEEGAEEAEEGAGEEAGEMEGGEEDGVESEILPGVARTACASPIEPDASLLPVPSSPVSSHFPSPVPSSRAFLLDASAEQRSPLSLPPPSLSQAPPPRAAMRVDLEALRSRLLSHPAASPASEGSRRPARGAYKAATLLSGGPAGEEEQTRAERELERVFDKADFARMEVLGQFNLGFIIAKIGQDLFIVDQHASDEKYNFERLQAELCLRRQPLLAKQRLTLSAAEELTIRQDWETSSSWLDNMAMFQANGFDFEEDDEGRLRLSAVPFSKNVVFSAEDVYELVNMLDGSGGAGKHGAELPLARTLGPGSQLRGPILRPSRLRAVLASRACRSSIMIGSALSMPTMRRILARLAGLQSPWNCPHGRPTMRHLCTLPELRG